MKPLAARPVRDRLVYVEWEDARGVTSEWTDVQTLAQADTCVCVSIGILLAKDRQRLVILPHYMGDDPYGGCGEMVIPRSQVRRMWALRIGREMQG